MRSCLECFPCTLKHTLSATRMFTDDESIQRVVMNKVMEILVQLPNGVTPPALAVEVHRIIRSMNSDEDPFKAVKIKYNLLALEMYEYMESLVNNAKDPMFTAVKLAIAGNIIDFGAGDGNFDLKLEIEKILSTDLAIDHYKDFRKNLQNAENILYLGDNTGEIVMDKLLISEMKKQSSGKIVFAVRGSPVINDVTLEDAEFVGMNEVTPVISNGYDAPGTLLDLCSSEFQECFRNSDMIVAKGMGNYESLSEEKKNIYFMLKVKCPLVARHTGTREWDNILLSNKELK